MELISLKHRIQQGWTRWWSRPQFPWSVKRASRKRAGFTLIELLVATLLVTVVILIAWSGLISLMNISMRAEARSFRQVEVNRALDFLTRELQTARYVNQTATAQVDGINTQIVDLLTREGFNLDNLGNYGDLALYLELPAAIPAPAICPAGGPNAGNAPPSPSDFDRVVYDVRPSPGEWLGPRTLMRYGRLHRGDGSFNPCDTPFASDPIADALSNDTNQTPACAGVLTGGPGFFTCQVEGHTQLLFQHTLIDAPVEETSTGVSSRLQPIQTQPIDNTECQNEANLRSLNSDTPASIHFVNQLAETVKVFWLDFDGNREQRASLASGETATLPTFLTHPWVVTDVNNACLGIYFPDQEKGVVNLTTEDLGSIAPLPDVAPSPDVISEEDD